MSSSTTLTVSNELRKGRACSFYNMFSFFLCVLATLALSLATAYRMCSKMDVSHCSLTLSLSFVKCSRTEILCLSASCLALNSSCFNKRLWKFKTTDVPKQLLFGIRKQRKRGIMSTCLQFSINSIRSRLLTCLMRAR